MDHKPPPPTPGPLDANAVMAEHAGWMIRSVESRARALGLNASDAEEAAADAVADIAVRALPRFDPSRGELRPYLNQCAYNAATSAACRIMRMRNRAVKLAAPEILDVAVTGTLDSQHIEQLAAAIIDDPSRWLTRRQCRVFVAVTQRGDKTLQAVSRELGYAQQTGLSQILRRIRERLAAAVGEDVPDEQRAKPRAVQHEPRHDSPPARSCRPTPTTHTPDAEAA